MLTTLLWITLIALIILLIAAASPIHMSCKVTHREGERDTKLHAAAHCLHPLILRAGYSTETERFYLFILGFKKNLGDGNDDQDINPEDTDTGDVGTRNVDTGNVDTGNVDTVDVDTNNINTDGINKDSAGTEDADTAGIDTNSINKEEKKSLMSTIKSKINDIKKHRYYKIINNKPLRKKLVRWLKRSSIRLIRTISLEKLTLHTRIGIKDPAKLGKIYGYFSAAQTALTPQRCRVDLNMEPVFMEKCLSIDSELKIKTTLSVILWQLTVIAITFPYWRVWKIIKSSSFLDERAR